MPWLGTSPAGRTGAGANGALARRRCIKLADSSYLFEPPTETQPDSVATAATHLDAVGLGQQSVHEPVRPVDELGQLPNRGTRVVDDYEVTSYGLALLLGDVHTRLEVPLRSQTPYRTAYLGLHLALPS